MFSSQLPCDCGWLPFSDRECCLFVCLLFSRTVMIQTWSWSWRTSSSYLLTHYRCRFVHFQTTTLHKHVSWLVCDWFPCVQGYGFPVNRLFDLLFEVRDQYSETLLKKWSLVFRYGLALMGMIEFFFAQWQKSFAITSWNIKRLLLVKPDSLN